jgi:hypothetical protein
LNNILPGSWSAGNKQAWIRAAATAFFYYFCHMPQNKKQVQKVILEVTFIIFLFYSNLLMGEFSSNGIGQKKGMWFALNDIFTLSNFTIAVVCALLGHLIFDYLRNNRF